MSRPERARQLLAGHALTAIATTLPTPWLLHTAFAHTHSATWVAVTGAARMLPYLALASAAGTLADRTRDHRRLLLRSAWTRALLLALLIPLIATAAPWPFAASTVVVLAAVATTAYPTAGAALTTFTSASTRATATGQLTALDCAAWVTGPALGGLLLALAPDWTVGAVAATLAATGALLFHRFPAHDTEPTTRRSDPRVSLAALTRSRNVRTALLAVATANIAVDGTAATLVLLAPNPHAYGLLAAALGTGAALAPLLGWRTTRPGRALTTALLVTAAPLVACAFTGELPVRAALLLTAGTAGIGVEIIATHRLRAAHPHHLGRCLALMDAVAITSALIGAALGPLLAATTTPALTVALLACLALAAALRPARDPQPPQVVPLILRPATAPARHLLHAVAD